jgi:hypothetical protein
VPDLIVMRIRWLRALDKLPEKTVHHFKADWVSHAQIRCARGGKFATLFENAKEKNPESKNAG